MKKYLISAALLLAVLGLKAQQGEIVYREFDPPLEFVQNIIGPPKTLELDFDGDGETDHRWYGEYYDHGEWAVREVSLNGWEIRLVGLADYITYTLDENDTLIPNAPEGWRRGPDYAYYVYLETQIYYEKYGMHKVIDGKNYYGWYHGYGMAGQEYSGAPYLFKVYIDKIAFCTIPDYPLRYGQTSITGVEENESDVFATIHPNPTTGLVTVTGKNLRQAEVVDMLGQQVLKVQGNGNELRIDMATMPSGIYFVTINDEEGRKCVRKLVRE
ncbi:MAG: T9SS type A sorting domain-containing protein [Bacteroidales bacterium]|nr:T9SS type A sorting domain-containing protein [Bacteroidales bacterium]